MSAAKLPDLRTLAADQRRADLTHARELVVMASRRMGRVLPEAESPRGQRIQELFASLVLEMVREEQGIPWQEK